MDNKYKKVQISKTRKVPLTYVPKGLSPKDKAKQIKSILEGEKRPKVKSFTSKRSSHVEKFQKRFGYKVSNKSNETMSYFKITFSSFSKLSRL